MRAIYDLFVKLWELILDFCKNFFLWMGERIIWVLGYLIQFFKTAGQEFTGAIFSLCRAYWPTTINWDGAQATLNKIDYFFPLSECISYLLLLGGLWILVFTYKVIKSWVPTLTGA